MFDDLKSIISGLDIFDLRQPNQFRFYSVYGFTIYLITYLLVISYDFIFKDECVSAITTGWEKIAKECGLTSGAVMLQFIFMNIAFALISLFKRANWSSDAIFNNLSLIIIIEALATVLFYQFDLADFIQRNARWYFIVISLVALICLSGMSFLIASQSRRSSIAATPGIFRLGIMYFTLTSGYYIAAVAVGLK
jgi:hypothetical protein